MNKQTQVESTVQQKPASKDQTQRPEPKDKEALLAKVLAFIVAKAV